MKHSPNTPLLAFALALFLVLGAIVTACGDSKPAEEVEPTAPSGNMEASPGGDVQPGPASYDECRLLGYTFQECVEFGLATPVAYTGPYLFSGVADARTEDFCVTSDKLVVEYDAPGGQDPGEIYYFVTVDLYDRDGQWIDGVSELEGSGSFDFSTDGPGCYYLAVTSYNTDWSITVSQ